MHTHYASTLKRLQNQKVIILGIPNSTRVAGPFIMIQGTLRSMNALRQHALAYSKFKKKVLNMDHWVQLAQFEAVTRQAMLLFLTRRVMASLLVVR